MELPYSLEAEQGVLGAFMVDKNTWFGIDKLNYDDFYIEIHQQIFQAMKALRVQDKPIDYIPVYEEFKKITNKASPKYLNAIASSLINTLNIERYIEILKEKSARRKIIYQCQNAINAAIDPEEEPGTIKAVLAQTLDHIGSEERDNSDRLFDICSELMDELENYDPIEAVKYYTGIPEIDKIMAGLHKEEVTVIAGRPGTGKTALALQISQKLAGNGLKVLFISREMSKIQIGKRLLTSNSKIEGSKLRSRKIEDGDWDEILKGINTISNYPIHINTKAKNAAQIRAKIREAKADVLIIDYLQLLEPNKRSSNREQQVSELSRDIKNISLDFNIPVVLLSQLNRAADSRRPTLADLRESGAIEQDANNVVLLHLPTRNEVQEAIEDSRSILTRELIYAIKNHNHKLVEVIIAKQRDGEIGKIYLEYVPQKLTFKSYVRR